jgi:hypothetical protein
LDIFRDLTRGGDFEFKFVATRRSSSRRTGGFAVIA